VTRAVRSLAALALAAVLVTGCAKRSHGWIVAGVGLAATAASSVAVASCYEEGCGSVVLLLLPSGALLISGVIGALTASSPDAKLPPDTAAPASEPDPEAVSLTARARMAADAGQCDGVQRMQPRVQRADPAYYQEVFLADPVIARCLAQTQPPAPAPAPAPTP
jgi:hypothetical protein